MPFAFSDGIGQALPAARLASATPVTAGCRMVKDAHELALMRRACAITLAAYRAVFASLAEGQTAAQVSGWIAAAHRRLGVRGGALVLFGPDAAFPHGTTKPRTLKKGDVVLVDGGCRVHGYQSDITVPPSSAPRPPTASAASGTSSAGRRSRRSRPRAPAPSARRSTRRRGR